MDKLEEVKKILTDDLIICGITREHAPPHKDCYEDCGVLKNVDGEPLGKQGGKHRKCMDCWGEYVDNLAKQICSLFEPKPEAKYHLACPICGGLFWSVDGFPDPQVCSGCKSDEAMYGGFYLCGNCQHPVKNGEKCHNCKPFAVTIDHHAHVLAEISKVGELVKHYKKGEQ